MEKNTYCPLFIDYVRECADQIGSLSKEFNTVLAFCVSINHKNCPFFRFLESPEIFCEYFKDCPLCAHYKNHDFDKFIDMAEAWCFKNFANCARFKIRQSGGMPPSNMLPNGGIFENNKLGIDHE